jgi:cyclopropane fatty-acyl-phospholipid synthase-like methyltransferase
MAMSAVSDSGRITGMRDAEMFEACFERASLSKLLHNRHPYNFIETYESLQQVFNYQTHYVNLGFWEDGFTTHEAGRLLVEEVAKQLDLRSGDHLLDVGSGLGQAAVDLCRDYKLGSVTGLNINPRQTKFANMLATREGLADKVNHILGDACRDLSQFNQQDITRIIAIECANHFSLAERFFHAAHELLGTGGRIALSINTAAKDLTLRQRWLNLAGFGFVPVPIQKWEQLLADSGFVEICTKDITQYVLGRGLQYALDRLQ